MRSKAWPPSPFAKPVTLNGTPPKEMQTFAENVDMRGNSLTVFLASCSTKRWLSVRAYYWSTMAGLRRAPMASL